MASNCFNYPKLNGAEGGVGGAAPGRASIVLQHLQQHQVRKDERAGSRLDGWLGHQPRPPPPCRVGNGLILHILQMERWRERERSKGSRWSPRLELHRITS